MNKFYFTVLLLSFPVLLKAQWGHQMGTMQIGGGVAKTDLGQSLHGNFNYYFTPKFSFEPKFNMEWGRPHQTAYSSMTIDAGLKYSLLNINDQFYLNLLGAGFGGVHRIDKFTTEYANFKPSYGVKTGGEIEAFLNQATSVGLFVNQLFLLEKTYGSKGYEVGFSLRVNMN